jgi:thymidylate synthase (FAD)
VIDLGVDPSEQKEIDDARMVRQETRRASVTALEEILYQIIPVLDHGFIRVVDYMGDDTSVVQAARVSYGKGTRRASDDRTLIRYLMRHSHTTPFEMAEIKLHIRLPIFVARQWIRHRTASVNEYSARYSVLDREFYIPTLSTLGAQAKDNRQGRGPVLSDKEAEAILHLLREDSDKSYEHYLWMLNESGDSNRTGIARELARVNLPLNTYTQWYWKTDLHNLMNFVHLRSDPLAQYEIRAYAEEIMKIMMRWVPVTFEAFLEYRANAKRLSATAVAIVSQMLKGNPAPAELAKLSVRERADLFAIFGIENSSLPKTSG